MERYGIMTAFTLDMSGPFQPGTGATDLGGPNVGGHQPPHWYEQYGMDFGAAEGCSTDQLYYASGALGLPGAMFTA
ncbi:hypothetical protein, partial [Streptomyces sp. NPDC005568]|uniref:hypothetical protein n=1 Tax=Streptomyces sp. NPDC005568 TaxID=3156887 RepID=UPI0033AA5C8A